ncbi:MAG: hypothetical protein GWP05_00145 [Anaerolineaceae bacterium]|nr:hypothetical protein [Anaerolineaceae bacterium]
MASEFRRPGLALLALIVYAALLHLAFLESGYPLKNHEALAGERTRGLIEEGHWLVPYLNGRPDFFKPPLPFWIAGGLSRLTGHLNTWTIRIPSVLACIGTMLLVVLLGRRMATPRVGLVCGLVFVTSSTALIWARQAEVDMQLCFWTTAALVACWCGLTESVRRRQVVCFVLMWLSLALAVLTKGPLPMALVAITLIVTALAGGWGGWSRCLGRMLPLVGPLIFLAVLAPWVIYVLISHPEAASAWYEQSLGRYGGELGNTKPFYYYLYAAPVLWLPWLLFVGLGVFLPACRRCLTRQALVFLLSWGLGGVVLLSFSAQKRMYYVLATVPAMMVLAGVAEEYVTFRWSGRMSRLVKGIVAAHVLVIPAVIAGVVVAAREFPDLKAALALFGGVAALGLAAMLWLFATRRRFAALLVFAVVVLVAQTLMLSGPLRQMASPRDRLTGRIVDRLLAANPALDKVAMYRWDKNMTPVPFLLGRSLPVFEQVDDLAAWRADHPGAFLVVRNTQFPGLHKAGSWQVVLPEEPVEFKRYYLLLKAVSPVESLKVERPVEESPGQGGPEAEK